MIELYYHNFFFKYIDFLGLCYWQIKIEYDYKCFLEAIIHCGESVSGMLHNSCNKVLFECMYASCFSYYM